MSSPVIIRQQIVEALRLDLVGPPNDHAFAHELLPQSPRRWYLTGFLVPTKADQEVKASGDDEMPEEAPAEVNNADDTETSDQQARVNFLPSSMGLSVLIGPNADKLEAVIRWGDYQWETEEELPEPDEDEAAQRYEEAISKLEPAEEGALPLDAKKKKRPRTGYRRESREEVVEIPVKKGGKYTFPIPNSRGLNLVVSIRPLQNLSANAIPAGSHAVSVFLVNDRQVKKRVTYRALVFQTEIELRCSEGFWGRPDLRGLAETDRTDTDESIADLHYRDVLEYTVGHSVSAECVSCEEGPCHAVRTSWIPSADVDRVDHFNPTDLELGMEGMGQSPRLSYRR